MKHIFFALATALSLSGCAAPERHPGRGDNLAAHHPAGATAVPTAERVDEQMKSMREMHRKMQAAKTPQERAALMGEHMKAMQGGMSMMCEMGASGGTRTGDATQSNDMMTRCMEMKDMTTQMMMEREGAKAPPAK